jgi:transcriptional regulator GlxA family with amidase domain
MHVGLLASDGCFSSGLTALIDVLSTAEAQRPGVDPSIPPVRVDVTGAGRKVTTGAGLTVPVTMHLRDLPAVDVVVVPALGTMTAEDTLSALEARATQAIIRVLGGLDPGVTTIAAACTGVFALAESGLLDRRRATTSWWLGAAFRGRYPSVVLDLDTMVVADAGVVTAGAAFAHIDLALALVRRVSPGLAEHVARLLVIDERASQSAYLAMDHLNHNDPQVLAFEQQARARLGEALDVWELAAVIGTSRRTLERRTQAALGMSPLALVQRLRAERAVHLLRTTAQSLEQIAPQVGYANASTLRSQLRRARTGQQVRPSDAARNPRTSVSAPSDPPRRPAPQGTVTPPVTPATSPKATASTGHAAARSRKSASATSSVPRPANGTGTAPHPTAS